MSPNICILLFIIAKDEKGGTQKKGLFFNFGILTEKPLTLQKTTKKDCFRVGIFRLKSSLSYLRRRRRLSFKKMARPERFELPAF